jgi:hypothetical protein
MNTSIDRFNKLLIHFVGVAPDQYYNATKTFGSPDYIHPRATWSAMGEIPKDDLVIFGRNAFWMPSKRKRKLTRAHDVPTTGDKS